MAVFFLSKNPETVVDFLYSILNKNFKVCDYEAYRFFFDSI